MFKFNVDKIYDAINTRQISIPPTEDSQVEFEMKNSKWEFHPVLNMPYFLRIASFKIRAVLPVRTLGTKGTYIDRLRKSKLAVITLFI